MFLLNGLGQKIKRSLGLNDTLQPPYQETSVKTDQTSYNQHFFNTTLAESAPYLPRPHPPTAKGLLPAAQPDSPMPHLSSSRNDEEISYSSPNADRHRNAINPSEDSEMVMRTMNGMSNLGASMASNSGQLNPRTQTALETAIVLSQQSTLSPSSNDRSVHNHSKDESGNGAITVSASPPLPVVSKEMTEIATVALRQADVFIKQKEWEKAIKACDRALSIDPTIAEAHKLMGNVLQYMGNPVDSISCYIEALVINPQYPEVYANLGTVYSTLEEWEQAFEYYQKAIELNPEFVGAYRHLVKAWRQLNQPEEYASKIQHAMVMAPEQFGPDEHCRMGDRLLEMGKEQDAIACFNRALSQQGDYAEAHQSLARMLEKQGNWEQAVNHYNQVLETSHPTQTPKGQKRPPLPDTVHPQKPEDVARTDDNDARAISINSLLSLARSYGQHGNFEKAVTHYKNALRLDPKAANIYQELADVLTQSGQPEQAIESWYRVVMLKSDWATPKRCVQVGNQLLNQNQPSKAIECYRRALNLDPNFAPAQEQLNSVLHSFSQSQVETTSSYSSPSDHSVATPIAHTGGAMPKKSDAASNHNAQADLTALAMDAHKQGEELANQERWQDAIVAYRRAIELNPDFSWSHHNLGKALFSLKDWQGAVEAQRNAIALDADFIWSHYSLGLALAQLEQWNEALSAYRWAKTLDPSIEAIGHSIVEALQALIKQNPREVALYQALAEERVNLGKFEEAIASYQMALQLDPFNQALTITLAQRLAPKDPAQSKALMKRALSVLSNPTLSPATTDLSDDQQAQSLLMVTNLFDDQYYRTRYNLEPVEDSLEHYLTMGYRQGYHPNPLFDTAYYLEQNPHVVQLGINPLVHYYQFGCKEHRDPHPFFSHALYFDTHPDVAATEICPLEHYLTCGAKEGRRAFSADQFPHLLQQPTPTDAEYLACLRGSSHQNGLNIEKGDRSGENRSGENHSVESKTFGIYCNSLGNYFITEIADYIAAALEAVGHQALRLSELEPPPASLDHHIIVAPHEFFYIGEGEQRVADMDWWSNAIMVNVEQPQTTWFSKAFHFLRRSRFILDISVKSAAMLQDLGLPAYWIPFGYLGPYAPFTGTEALPDLLALKGLPQRVRQTRPDIDAPLADRPIDLHFVGTLSDRRNTFFAESASWLHHHRCFLHIPPMGNPLIEGQGQALDTDAVIGLSRRSKILLNIHRDELPYFEWHRIVFHGLWQNTLVVTEPCHDVPGLLPNVHYVSCPLNEMEQKIRWLLQDPTGQAEAERIRRAGYLALKQTFHFKQIMQNALMLIETKK